MTRDNGILVGETIDDFIKRLISYEEEDAVFDLKAGISLQKKKTNLIKKYRAATSISEKSEYMSELYVYGIYSVESITLDLL